MATAQQIYEAAVRLMDAQNETTGAADTAENRDYRHRALDILNLLCQECFSASDGYRGDPGGARPVCPALDGLEQEVPLDEGLCRGVLPYGLAAHLIADENPELASFFQRRYEELLVRARRWPRGGEDVADLYGGVEFGRFARW